MESSIAVLLMHTGEAEGAGEGEGARGGESGRERETPQCVGLFTRQ